MHSVEKNTKKHVPTQHPWLKGWSVDATHCHLGGWTFGHGRRHFKGCFDWATAVTSVVAFCWIILRSSVALARSGNNYLRCVCLKKKKLRRVQPVCTYRMCTHTHTTTAAVTAVSSNRRKGNRCPTTTTPTGPYDNFRLSVVAC